MRARAARGARAESTACRWLEAHGLITVSRNFHCRYGELDLIMLDGDLLVVVEVRSRSSDRFLSPASSIDEHKQARIVRATEYFLQQNPRYAGNAVRFDVVTLTGSDTNDPDWIRDAFTVD